MPSPDTLKGRHAGEMKQGQHRMIPGGGARQKIFCKVNQKAQTILGWIDEHFWKTWRKILG